MKTKQLFCRIKNGLMPNSVLSELQSLAKKAGEGDYVIEIKKKTRSNAQNRYYWGVMVETVRKALNTHLKLQGLPVADKDDVHLFMLDKIGRVHRIKTESGELVIKKGLSKTDTQECEDCFTAMRAYFAERGIDIKEPNEDRFNQGE